MSQLQESLDSIQDLLRQSLELILDDKATFINVQPKAEINGDGLREVWKYLKELGFSLDPYTGVYEKLIGDECVKVSVDDGRIAVWKEQLENCSKHLLAEIIRKHLWVKEVKE